MSHGKSKCHLEHLTVPSNQLLITTFNKSVQNDLSKNVRLAEIVLCYHNVKHRNSYLFMDCCSELYKHVFCDSKIAAELKCKRTKTSEIVKKQISKISTDIHLKNSLYRHYAVSIDSSTFHNKTVYPIVVSYYKIESGINYVLLDIHNSMYHDAKTITGLIEKSFNKYSIPIEMITSFNADNAFVNYGTHNSIYINLKAKNKYIMSSNCNCHVIHNAVKFSLKKCSIDLESFIYKIYKYFKVNEVNTDDLRVFCELEEVQYVNILKHVGTRWLSITPAVERIIKLHSALKSYFETVQVDSDNIFLDVFSSESRTYYLFLFHFIYCVFNFLDSKIKILESNYLLVSELYDVMDSIRIDLSNRIEMQFFGEYIITNINKLDDSKKDLLVLECNQILNSLYTYLSNHFAFNSNNILFKYKKFNLLDSLNITCIKEVTDIMGISYLINFNCLFSELLVINNWIISFENSNTTSERYKILYSKHNNLPEYRKIVGAIFSIPTSNAQCERLFSFLGRSWTQSRNLLLINSLTAELQIINNLKFTCSEFYKYLLDNNSVIHDLDANPEPLITY